MRYFTIKPCYIVTGYLGDVIRKNLGSGFRKIRLVRIGQP